MAGSIGGSGGASGGLGSSGGIGMSIAAATRTDFSAQSRQDEGASSASSANARVATGFDPTAASTNDFGSGMAMLAASGSAEPYGGADATLWRPRPDDEAQATAAMQPSDDVLAQVCAAYSASQG